MFKDIWGLFAAGGVAGLFAGLLLVATVRHIFRHYWFSWGLMESSDTLPVTHDVHTRWLDASLVASCALCGAVITASVPWASPSGPELLWSRSVFCALLVMQARIDAQTGMLPDRLTLGMLWLGLLAAVVTGRGAAPFPVGPTDAIVGAAVGYLCLWSVYWLFRLITGREGMGRGDFKLLAALGAWLGWTAIPLIVLLSALVGALVGGVLILFRGRDHRHGLCHDCN